MAAHLATTVIAALATALVASAAAALAATRRTKCRCGRTKIADMGDSSIYGTSEPSCHQPQGDSTVNYVQSPLC
eukprot:COSAG01_NODE_6412_length_3678_cov_4.864767_2_plen_74_part_00